MPQLIEKQSSREGCRSIKKGPVKTEPFKVARTGVEPVTSGL